MKNLAIIGATGATGSALLDEALLKGYRVKAVVRTPDKLKPRIKLEIVRGDVIDADGLAAALQGIDYVIACFGPSDHKAVGDLMSAGARNVVKACELNGVNRFVFMSGFVQSEGEEFSLINRWAIKLLRRYYHASYADKVIAESTIENSALDWVIVRAVALADKPAAGEYKAGVLARVSPFNALPYADCANCLLDALHNDSWTNQIINVGKAP